MLMGQGPGVLEIKCPFNKGSPGSATPPKLAQWYYMPQVCLYMQTVSSQQLPDCLHSHGPFNVASNVSCSTQVKWTLNCYGRQLCCVAALTAVAACSCGLDMCMHAKCSNMASTGSQVNFLKCGLSHSDVPHCVKWDCKYDV